MPEQRKKRRRPTSREAWASMAGEPNATLDALIVQELDRSRAYGLICQEIEDRIGRSHQAVSGNLRHLVQAGIVKATRLRGKTSSNRSAIRWVCHWHWHRETHEDLTTKPAPPAATGAQLGLGF